MPALVDRDEEVARIAEALDAAERGEGQLLLLRGEAGCGKTRLLQEAAGEASRRGFTSGFGTALSESVIPYHPWREALVGLGLARILEEGPPPKLLGVYVVTSKGKIVARAERKESASQIPAAVSMLRAFARGTQEPITSVDGGGPLSSLAAGEHRIVAQRADGCAVGAVVEGLEDEGLLSDLNQIREVAVFSMEKTLSAGDNRGKERSAVDEALRSLLDSGKYEGIDYSKDDPKLRQARLFDQIALGLTRKAGLHPQLVAIDDLQWADPSSLALLQYVARNTRKARVLVLGAYRVEEAGARPHLKDALRKMEQERLPAGILVPGLPQGEMRRLAGVFLGPHALPGDFLDLLWHETQGYPLFIREVLRGLQEEGAIRVRGAAKRLERPAEQLAIPVRVREAIRLRLEKLPRAERRLLDAAAACGTRFTAALLAKVAGGEESDVLIGLQNLVRVHGLLRQTENGFAFDHPVVQEVAHVVIPDDIRRTYHVGAAQWLELVGGPKEDIAEHYYLARDPRGAVRLREAAEAAAARYANHEAVRFYSEALDLEKDPERRAEMLEALGNLSDLLGDYEGTLIHVQRALELSAGPRGKSRLLSMAGRACIMMGKLEAGLKFLNESLTLVQGENCEEEAIALNNLGILSDRRGDYEDAMKYHGQSLAIREQIRDERGVAGSLSDIGRVLVKTGHHDAALEHLNRAVEISSRIGNLRWLANHLSVIGGVQLARGEYDKALENYQGSVAIYKKIGDLAALPGVISNIGVVRRQRGDYEAALQCSKEALALAKKLGRAKEVALHLANIADALRIRGEYVEALENLERSVAIEERVGDKHMVALYLCALGDVCFDMGNEGEALKNYEKSVAMQEEMGERMNLSWAFERLSRVRLERGENGEALNAGDRALALAVEMGQKDYAAGAKRALGAVYRELGKWDEAIENLEGSIRVWAELGSPAEEAASFYDLGLLWSRKGDTARAEEFLRKAIEMSEKVGSAATLRKAREAYEDVRQTLAEKGRAKRS